MRKASLKDIAGKVGVSTTAVSKVLNDIPIRISPDKRRRIKETARAFNYNPNILARSLRNKKTKSVGIIVPDITSLFYPELIRNIEMKLSSHGYRCIICNSEDNPACEKSYIEDLLGRWVDGLVVAPAKGNENMEFLSGIYKSGLPILLIDRYFLKEKIPYIISDNRMGAVAGARFLIQSKVEKIVYLGDKDRNRSIDDRLLGIKKQAFKNRMPFGNREIFLCGMNRREIRTACLEMFRSISGKRLQSTGIFLESNKFLMGLLDAAKERNLCIPDDLKIIGFDPFEPDIVYPEDFASLLMLKGAFPVIKQDVKRMGELTADFLTAALAGKQLRCLREKVPVKITY